MAVLDFFSSLYRRTGIQGAPPGTLFFNINSFIQSILHRQARGYASEETIKRAAFGATSYYNIARLRRTRPVNGLALVFFIGAGDYLMATQFIRELHYAHPDLPIYAYASSHADNISSPLVLHFLRANPLITKVFAYDGRPRPIWTEYDFSDAMEEIPSDFAILPVIYDVDEGVYHRHTSLLETFGLRVELPVPLPYIDKGDMSEPAEEILKDIHACIRHAEPKGVVCTHFGARSSGYDYPHAARLVWLLLNRGFVVISFSPTGMKHENLVEIDISKISPTDSVEILRSLKASVPKLSIISINSIMWPLSAALSIPNLGLHIYWDGSIHQYLYPNIYVMTQHLYRSVSPCRLVLAPVSTYDERQPPNSTTTFTDYKPEFVADSFQRIFESLDS